MHLLFLLPLFARSPSITADRQSLVALMTHGAFTLRGTCSTLETEPCQIFCKCKSHTSEKEIFSQIGELHRHGRGAEVHRGDVSTYTVIMLTLVVPSVLVFKCLNVQEFRCSNVQDCTPPEQPIGIKDRGSVAPLHVAEKLRAVNTIQVA